MKSKISLRKSIRNWTLFFITGLVLSGLTAFTPESELAWLNDYFIKGDTAIYFWIHRVYISLKDTNEKYPFLATDTTGWHLPTWLLLSHSSVFCRIRSEING